MEVAMKPRVGYTHKITEAGVTWLALVGTNTKYDGTKVAYPENGDVVSQITRVMRVINESRMRDGFRMMACRYEGRVIG